MTNNALTRREILRGMAVGTALAFAPPVFAAKKKSILLFTKSSGFEHDVIKVKDGQPSVVEVTLRSLGEKHGFDVDATKDGRIFDSKEFRSHNAVFFFTTGDLTQSGTDQQPPMSAQGKQALLDAVHDGLGFVGAHAATDTFHTQPDAEDRHTRYVAYGENSDPYLRMVGGEFIVHGRDPRLQTANLIVTDPKFPGLEGVTSPIPFNEEWYSMKDFQPDLHVILTLDTSTMRGEPYQRPAYPVTWARRHGRGPVFYTAMGDLAANWQIPFFVSLLGGGIRWAIGDASASLDQNLAKVAPGYATIPPELPPKK